MWCREKRVDARGVGVGGVGVGVEVNGTGIGEETNGKRCVVANVLHEIRDYDKRSSLAHEHFTWQGFPPPINFLIPPSSFIISTHPLSPLSVSPISPSLSFQPAPLLPRYLCRDQARSNLPDI